ncbi:TniQ family protein [Agarivorans sp. QJM3NY_29]|uniref:TniQ family protein n=1 Tax=unclassified Agarivorans TaxID=2636026 RepID=UPI003F6D3F4D
MTRAARCNGRKLSGFVLQTCPQIKAFTKHIDSSIKMEALKDVAGYMHTPLELAWNTTLGSYAGWLFESAEHKCNLLRAGETRHHLLFQQYCPVCLREGIPYYRKSWRISFVTVCYQHQCRLLDCCHKCGAPVMVNANDSKDKFKVYNGEFSACHSCGNDLRTAPCSRAKKGVLSATKVFLDTLDKGYVSLDGRHWVYSFSYFIVIKHLMRLLIERHQETRNHGVLNDVDCLPIDARYLALAEIGNAFSSWPDLFLEFCRNKALNYSSMTSMEKTNNGNVPYWFSKAVKPQLYRPNIEPSNQSVICAIKVMRARRIKISISRVNRFMGYKDSQAVKKITKEYWSSYAK